MNTNYPCYKLGRTVNSEPVPMDNLRLETSTDCFYLLSYHHVEMVKFESTQDADSITISFLNRTVRIKGKNLRTLGVALQSRHVEFIKPMAERYSSLAAGEEGWVKTIEILEQKEDSHA
jgi:hypothetical protein